ncbi:MAG TPA: hypothetical protein ENH28_00055 [Euryarchaeota archaeon]|nr:hypothetical protein [Euryarchaeota archaeon]
MSTYKVELSEKLALYSSYLVPIGIIILSLISIFNDTMIQPNTRAFILDLIFLLFGSLLLSGSYRANKKFNENIVADKEFKSLLLEKFGPFLKELSRYQITIDELSEKIESLNRRVSYISKGNHGAPSYIGMPFAPNINFLIRSLYLSILTLGSIIFLYTRISTSSIYVILILIFLWWYLITDEYDFFDDISAYIFIIFPILIVPISSLVLLAYFNLPTLQIFLFLILIFYIVSYYTVATYYATGRIPFIEKPMRTYRNGGTNKNMNSGGISTPDKAESVKEILDKLIERKPPYQRNGGKDYDGIYIQEKDTDTSQVKITVDKDILAEALALYISTQTPHRNTEIFNSDKPSFIKSFLSVMYDKIKEFK